MKQKTQTIPQLLYTYSLQIYFIIQHLQIFKSRMSSIFDNRVFQFFYGALGTYAFAFVSSILHEKILKRPYLSRSTDELDDFHYPIVFLLFPYLIGSILGQLTASCTGQIVRLPRKNLMYTAAMVCIGTLTYNIAILEISYPIVIMVKSCSILSAIIVGVCCSRVSDHRLKLGPSKLIVGGLVTLGIFLFNHYTMEDKGEKGTNLLGMVLLIVSLIADGLLPDFQAEMKSKYNPRPVDLMFQINQWVFIFSLLYSIVSMELWQILSFGYDHPQLAFDLLAVSILNFGVQMFVYYLIQKFKQHIAPFVITIRKIFSVVISIFWFNHAINAAQWVGVIVVFSAAVFDFISEKYCKAKETDSHSLKEQPERINNIVSGQIDNTEADNARGSTEIEVLSPTIMNTDEASDRN